MADEIDAKELLERIRRARDWATQEAEYAMNYGSTGEDSNLEALAASIRGSALRAVQETLDKILEPQQTADDA
ncbi:hypothetical protein SCYAM73S_02501 [Streptomyces cyaneofuscatus]|uniref:hypothetical protein n=1 Tax=Streptomyces TaxID=1883 RepID=UPI0004C4BA3C|nr:hypothetical protein [Streptomyces cyaneofuscatus]